MRDYGRAPHKGFDFRSWRKRMGWTQQEAADQLALSRNGYRIYETGYDGLFPRRVPKPVIRLAEVLETVPASDRPVHMLGEALVESSALDGPH